MCARARVRTMFLPIVVTSKIIIFFCKWKIIFLPHTDILAELALSSEMMSQCFMSVSFYEWNQVDVAAANLKAEF